MDENPANYFRKYRNAIGFSNQNGTKKFLAGKDILPGIDYTYINELNNRLVEIIEKINTIAKDSCLQVNSNDFSKQHIYSPYSIIKDNDLLRLLNNQSRRPETVLFSWLRGYAIAEYFTPAFSKLFGVSLDSIIKIGDDDLRNIETFRRSPKADLEITRNGQKVRVEVQSGFQGINDIKEHKIREARKIMIENKVKTVCIHIDIFNGQVAFVPLDIIQENDVNFITRQQMEGQSVLSIDQNYFKWRLLDKLPEFDELELSL